MEGRRVEEGTEAQEGREGRQRRGKRGGRVYDGRENFYQTKNMKLQR